MSNQIFTHTHELYLSLPNAWTVWLVYWTDAGRCHRQPATLTESLFIVVMRMSALTTLSPWLVELGETPYDSQSWAHHAYWANWLSYKTSLWAGDSDCSNRNCSITDRPGHEPRLYNVQVSSNHLLPMGTPGKKTKSMLLPSYLSFECKVLKKSSLK